ncbi:glycosyltransferase 87 family protein [Gordonia sp. HY002]|uniref:glycosyltransferase 87 family protein n=1 Tax=Gordonia zhenghanii TaxID=2911516 RepID=UPI001EF0663C|nr:glycosyltransferase 87 family protein [Gordonia zhenghanii]MCF8569205.1 glycosyltransferase 87 family protein [Gordonia zhenghanii]MCF8603563.1 glycosyltransferase 87 family protein [Gordonia zhenghanii]
MKLERSTPALIGFVIAGALSLWLQYVIVPYSTPYWGLFDNFLDLDVYRAGAQVVLDGGDLYDAKLLGQMDFTYAPFSMALFVPFALMSATTAHAVWTIGIFVALYFVIVLGFRSLGHDVTWRLRVIAASLVAASALLEPVRSTIWFGQINVFLMLLIVADLIRPEGSRLRGLGAGLAAGIKLTPMLFVVYFAAVRQWKTVVGVIGGFVGSVLVGFIVLPAASWKFWTDTVFDSDRVSSPQTVGNQSIRGGIANVYSTDHPSTVIWIASAVVVLALVMTAAVLAHRRGQELLALSLVGMASCTVSPVSWGHHWVWFVPLLVVAVHHLIDGAGRWRRGLIGALTVLGVLATAAWRTHLAYPIWYANRSVEEAYLTGLFFKHDLDVIGWFAVQPYNVLLVVVATATIGLCLRPSASTDPPVTAVGDRR